MKIHEFSQRSPAEGLEDPPPCPGDRLCADRGRGAVEHLDLGGGLSGNPADFVSRSARCLPVSGLLPGVAGLEKALGTKSD